MFPCEYTPDKCKSDLKGFTAHTCGKDLARDPRAMSLYEKSKPLILPVDDPPYGPPDKLELKFKVYDSGERKVFSSGMQRDTTTGKINYALALDGPMFERYAEHLRKGAEKYNERNWMKAAGQEELDRFRESALRHFMQWFRGDVDEDHAAAVYFNINGAEYVKERISREDPRNEIRRQLEAQKGGK